MNLEHQRSRRVNRLCSLLGYSRQAFYQHTRAAERTALQHDLIIQQVLLVRATQARVGTRKLLIMLTAFMSSHHIAIGRDGLFELLRDNRLLLKARKRRVPRTTFSDHWMHKYPNLTIGLCPLAAHQLWVSDITYVAVAEGFGYLSLVTDGYSRMIVGYHLDRTLKCSGAVKALSMAMRQLPDKATLIHHSDRGTQYCSMEYVEQLQARQIAISMTQNSDPRENAIAERVNGILKEELLKVRYESMSAATKGISGAVAVYNWQRLHGSVDMHTPAQAHEMSGELKRHWKSYYRTKRKEVDMPAG